MAKKITARAARQPNGEAVVVRQLSELKMIIETVEEAIGSKGAREKGRFTKGGEECPESLICAIVTSALFGDIDNVSRCCALLSGLFSAEMDIEGRHMGVQEALLGCVRDLLTCLDDSVLAFLDGRCEPDAVLRKACEADAVLLAARRSLAPTAEPALSKLESLAAEAMALFGEANAANARRLPETDAILLGYVDLAILRPQYGLGKVAASTVSSLRKAGFTFADLVERYLAEDLPGWLAAEVGKDARQAQLIAAALARIDERYGIVKKSEGRTVVDRDAVVMRLLCEHDFCRR